MPAPTVIVVDVDEGANQKYAPTDGAGAVSEDEADLAAEEPEVAPQPAAAPVAEPDPESTAPPVNWLQVLEVVL